MVWQFRCSSCSQWRKYVNPDEIRQKELLRSIHPSLKVKVGTRRVGRVEVEIGGGKVLNNRYKSVEVGLPVVCAALKNLYQVRVQSSTHNPQYYLERDQEHTASEKFEPFLDVVGRSANVSMADNMSKFLKCFGMVFQ